MESGEELFRFRFNEPARACKFSVGERQAAISTDPFMNSVSAIRVFNIAEDPRDMLQVGAGGVTLRVELVCTCGCCRGTRGAM